MGLCATGAGRSLLGGTLRYFDGSAWTGHVASPSTLTTWSISGAVWWGILIRCQMRPILGWGPRSGPSGRLREIVVAEP